MLWGFIYIMYFLFIYSFIYYEIIALILTF